MSKTTRRTLYLTALALTCAACSSGHDSKTEDRMIKALSQHRTDQVNAIDLNTILPKGWSKVCVQTAYMMQEELEKQANIPLKHYKTMTDDANVIMWVFYAKGNPTYMTIPRKTVMDFSSPNVIHTNCTDPQQPALFMTMINDTKTYYFN